MIESINKKSIRASTKRLNVDTNAFSGCCRRWLYDHDNAK